MIAACPSCSARYRIEPERLRPDGVRLRCSRCESIFRVRPPVAAAEPDRESAGRPAGQIDLPTPSGPTPVVRNVDAPGVHARQDETDEVPSPADRARMVLIADPDVQSGKATAHAVEGWGLTPILVHDGVEAIMSIQRMLPKVVVMDAALPKMFGFQVCELLKRNESLRHIHVVLVGAIHNRERYRRSPTELYGADSYIENHELSTRLREVLEGIGMPIGKEISREAPVSVRPVPESAPVAEPPPVVAPPPVAPPPPVFEPSPAVEPVEPPAVAEPSATPTSSPSPTRQVESLSPPDAPPDAPPAIVDPKVADAERLARIVVSDIILYNPEKFETGVRDGNVLELMASDLAEGRSMFDNRVEASVRGERDFLADRLVEVARERGMS